MSIPLNSVHEHRTYRSPQGWHYYVEKLDNRSRTERQLNYRVLSGPESERRGTTSIEDFAERMQAIVPTGMTPSLVSLKGGL